LPPYSTAGNAPGSPIYPPARARRRPAYPLLATHLAAIRTCRGRDRLFFCGVCLYIPSAGFVRLWR